MEGVPPIILGTKNVKNFYFQSLDTLGAAAPPRADLYMRNFEFRNNSSMFLVFCFQVV